ncbi:hypothetical protein NKR23_g7267 [Pleurostoma richardsiae]|uniref:Uncharacterized protein n=1 Tax=Pleurostoma richardsiae TaxID=41990 RepID=A0AA38VRB0_9PEZI|nr:hypothetical protein NKR23_g7267 [Pleurostoma richardsiae]
MGQGPTKPVKGSKFRVIGAGMTRTGTKTFREALQILLDGPVHDGPSQAMGGPRRHGQGWLEAMELAVKPESTAAARKKLNWLLLDLMDGYVGTTDMPATLMVSELLEAFPDAIVIVTTREPDSWWKSQRLLESYRELWWLPWLIWPAPRLNNFPRFMELQGALMKRHIGVEGFDGPDGLQRHEKELQRMVPPEKLFFYRCSDGWEPLCKILDVPVPDRTFPHNNGPDEVRRAFRLIVAIAQGSRVLIITPHP